MLGFPPDILCDPHARPSPRWSVPVDGGEGWIRTSVRLRGQIYSLLPLTTRPPLHEVRQARHVAAPVSPVNAGISEELSPLAKLGRSMLACPPDRLCVERVKGIEPSS